MNSRTTSAALRSSYWMIWCAIITITPSLFAQTQQRYYPQPQGGAYPQQPQYSQPAPPPGYSQPQGYAYPPQPQPRYESPIQFLPKFGKRMSEMVRRLFYGQDPTGYDYPPTGYGANGSRNLDADPRQYQYPSYPQQQQPQQVPSYQYPQQQAQPRYSYPPQPQTPQPQNRSATPAPAPQSKPPSSSSNSTKKYSPPKVTPTPSRTPDKPSTIVQKKEVKPDLPPPTTPTTRRSETTPKEPPTTASSGGSGSFLKGKKTSKPGRVISPYPPYKELDITGLESGSLALDPTTQKVFEVP